MTTPAWLGWLQQIQALAQDGLAYSQNPFDIERYQALTAIAAKITGTYGGVDFEMVQATFAREAGYATPKLDVRGVVFVNDKLLLVRELSDGHWTLPGGWVDVGEPLSRAVEREVQEESGYEVKAFKVLAIFDRNSSRHQHPPYIFHLYKIFVMCQMIGGKPVSSIETEGAQFFAEDEIPPLSISRTTLPEIELMFTHLREPNRPTDFD